MDYDLRLRPPICRAAALLSLVSWLAACADDGEAAVHGAAGGFSPVEAGVLTVVTELPAAGFWDGDAPDDLRGGFEYELAQQLAERFELDHVEVVDVPFDEIVAGEADDFDVAIAQISITPERSGELDFSVPYLTTPVGAVGRSDIEVDDLADARDLRWGAAEATTEVDVVDDLIRPRDGEPETYETVEAALAAVRAGEVDLVALDYLRALAEVVASEGLGLAAEVAAPQHYGVALPDGSDNRDAVDAAIRRLKADGTLRRLTDDLYDELEDGVDRDVPTLRVEP